MVTYTPKQGDIIKLDLDPTKGHEQAGFRPALVINNDSFSRASNMVIVCPITNTHRNNPLRVPLQGLTTTGYVLCDQIRAIDLSARKYKVVENARKETLWEVCDIVQGAVELEASH